MMRKFLVLLILLLIIFAIPGISLASLSYSVDGVRPMGMGGAFVAVADDANAIFYNPAGLGLLKKNEALASYDSYNISLDHPFNYKLVCCFPTDFGTLAVAGDQAEIEFSIPYPSEEEYYYIIRKILVSYGVAINKDLFLGASIKNDTEEIRGETSFGANYYGGSIGVLYRPINCLMLGLSIDDLFKTRLKYNNGIEEDVSASLSLGIAFRPYKNLTFAADIVSMDIKQNNASNLIYKIGVEAGVAKWLILRAGCQKYNNIAEDVYVKTLGLGFIFLKNLRLDYAFDFSIDPVYGMHHLSLDYKF